MLPDNAEACGAGQTETPGGKVRRLRAELAAALRDHHAAEGPGRADEPELFRSARVWHLLRSEKRALTPREVMVRVYSNEPPSDNLRRSASSILHDLEQRGLAERAEDKASWFATRTAPTQEDIMVLGALDRRLRTAEEIAAAYGMGAAQTLESLRRLSLLGLAQSRMRGRVGEGVLAWRAETSPFAASATLYGLDEKRSTGSTETAGATKPPPKVRVRPSVDLDALPRIFAALPAPQAAPVTAETVTTRVYGPAQVETRLHAVRCALRSLRLLGLVVGSRTTDQWTQRVRAPSEDDELVLAALDATVRPEHDVIASVWPEATADQATAVADSLRRLRVLGLAERVPAGQSAMRWRRTKAVP